MPTTLTRKPLSQREGARTISKRPSGLFGQLRMPDEAERDNTEITVGQVCRSSPKNIARVVSFYVFLEK